MIEFRCPHCNRRLGVQDSHGGREGRCVRCNKPIVAPMAIEQTAEERIAQLVYFNDRGALVARWNNLDDAKLILSEINDFKPDLTTLKAEVELLRKKLNADNTDRIRRRLPKFPAGGKLGFIIRTTQTAVNHIMRRNHTDETKPLTDLIHFIETAQLSMQHTTNEIKRYLKLRD